MITKLSHVTIWVKNQDGAKKFYVETLGFKVVMDDSTTMPGYRWLTVSPQQQSELEIVLGPAAEPQQVAQIGKQGTWVLASDNIQEDYRRLKARDVKIHYEPRENPYGTDFVFEDLYGNTFDLVQAPSR
jgi:catechol 2,3-dioxygenase-like lactoylglutathione lyase family enzyme